MERRMQLAASRVEEWLSRAPFSIVFFEASFIF
jgi:hypothetical protein